jgi:hypothetical protein
MDPPASLGTVPTGRRLGARSFDALAVALVFVAYTAVFLFMGNPNLVAAARASFINLVPLIIVAAAARALVARYLVKASLAVQVAGHVGFAALFTLSWHWLLMVSIGVGRSASPLEFAVRKFFDHPAMTWQLLQGLFAYAFVACLTYLRAQPPMPSFVVAPREEGDPPKDPALSRYFIRQGEDIHPVDVSQIVSITGADDYAEVATMSGRHLVRMTLSEFEKTLEAENFIRVHRSRIVNVARITRAEPAGGGRMLLHMENGEMIQASRTGSKLLRDRVI